VVQISRWKKIRRVLLVILSIYGSYVVFGWWGDTQSVVTFRLGEVSPAAGHPNDLLVFHQPVHKSRNCWGTVRRVMLGECGFFIISETPAWIMAPWEGRLTYAVQIPHEAIPGLCGLQVVARFVCNPLDIFGSPRLAASTPIPFRVLRYDE